jgi:hypothetical protein
MDFKTINIIKFPVDVAWNTMRDKLPDIAKDVNDLESITEVERVISNDGNMKIVNVWKAKPNLPAMVIKYINKDMLTWTDTANWIFQEKKIDWQIHSHHFHEEMHCKGSTAFETAMGGKGCRLTFTGSLEWKGKVLSLGLGIFDNTIAKAVEGVLTQMIPSNFRKITEVMSKYIERNEDKK